MLARLDVRAPEALATLGGGKWIAAALRTVSLEWGSGVIQRGLTVVLDPSTAPVPDETGVQAPLRKALGMATLVLTEADFNERCEAGKKVRDAKPPSSGGGKKAKKPSAGAGNNEPPNTVKRPSDEKRGAKRNHHEEPLHSQRRQYTGGGTHSSSSTATVLPEELRDDGGGHILAARVKRNAEGTLTYVGVSATHNDEVSSKLTPGRTRTRIKVVRADPSELPREHGGLVDNFLDNNDDEAVISDTLSRQTVLRTDYLKLGGKAEGRRPDHTPPDQDCGDPLYLLPYRLELPVPDPGLNDDSSDDGYF